MTVTNNIGFVDIKFPWPEVQSRWKYSYRLPDKKPSSQTSWFGGYYSYGPQITSNLKSAPPHNLTVMYGLKNVLITRQFAEFVIESPVGQQMREWLRDVLVAVEHFYSTMATVSMEGDKVIQTFDNMEQLNKFKMRKTFWEGEYRDCHGKIKREICNLALGDLPAILSSKAFVINKFDTDLDGDVVDCLREIVYG